MEETMRHGPATGANGRELHLVSLNQEEQLLVEELAQKDKREITSYFPIAFRLRGPVDAGCLEASINALIDRHQALRAVYHPAYASCPGLHETLLAVFRNTGRFLPGMYQQSLPVDGRHHVTIREGGVCRRATSDNGSGSSVTLEDGPEPDGAAGSPLLRAAVYRFDEPGDYMLVLTVSHLAVDGWSMQIIRRELRALYSGLRSGRKQVLPEPTAQHHDFAAWEQRCAAGGHFHRELAYWRGQWSEWPAAHIRHGELPFALAPAAGRRPLVRLVRVAFTPAETERIRSSAKELRATLYVLFRTVLAVQLYQYTGRRRIAFWANYANRRYRGAGSMIGWCSNRHSILVDLGGNPTGAELCARMSVAVREGAQHEALPLAHLWQTLGRRLDRVETRITFDAWARLKGDDEFQPVTVIGGRQWKDLDVRVRDEGPNIAVEVSYNSARYDPVGVATMLCEFQRTAMLLVERADCRLAELRAA